jgi:hypothetical protein
MGGVGLEVNWNFGVPIFKALDLAGPKINIKSWIKDMQNQGFIYSLVMTTDFKHM